MKKKNLKFKITNVIKWKDKKERMRLQKIKPFFFNTKYYE